MTDPLRIQRGMPLLIAKYESQVAPIDGSSFAIAQFKPTRSVIMLVPTTQAATSIIINTSVVECNTCVDCPYQRTAFYLSVLSCFFPSLLPLSKEVLRDRGYNVTEICDRSPDLYEQQERVLLSRRRREGRNNLCDCGRFLLPYENLQVCVCECKTKAEPTIGNASLAVFGQLALIIYKNIDERSYGREMRSWAAAIKHEAGVVCDLVPGEGDIVLLVSTAKIIHRIMGNSSEIHVGLLNIFLANRDGVSPLSRVCNYVAEIISWSNMAQLKLVFESLCLTRSPVLVDLRVKHEVLNLCVAYMRIKEKQYPQYYRIRHPSEAGVTVVNSRFETLAEVARQPLIPPSDLRPPFSPLIITKASQPANIMTHPCNY
ncbi:hypothetical protein E3N88_41307 [Mikania micrantha]|uniref:Uncharacterized protein n=1 Tax=Mikania micrantha TaxID=192012 RepID=A0A5N6LQ17_9ASTR|nr:hypothetical protein E3N88_41307 [Mikania micrantha]